MNSYFGNLTSDFSQYLPNFKYELIDISEMPDETIQKFRNLFLSTVLALMKYRENEQFFFDNLSTIFVQFEPNIETEEVNNFLDTLIVYTSKVYKFTNQNLDNLMETLEKKPRSRKKAMTFYDYFVDKGMTEGMEKGIEQTKIEATINAHKNDIPIEIIANITNLSIEAVKDIIAKHLA